MTRPGGKGTAVCCASGVGLMISATRPAEGDTTVSASHVPDIENSQPDIQKIVPTSASRVPDIQKNVSTIEENVSVIKKNVPTIEYLRPTIEENVPTIEYLRPHNRRKCAYNRRKCVCNRNCSACFTNCLNLPLSCCWERGPGGEGLNSYL